MKKKVYEVIYYLCGRCGREYANYGDAVLCCEP